MIRNSLHDRAVAVGTPPRLRAHIYGPLYLALFLVCAGIIAAATILGVAIGHRSPINWIGIGFVALGFLCYAVRETLPADICASLEDYPLARKVLGWCGRCNGYLKFEEERLIHPRVSRVASDPASTAPVRAPGAPASQPQTTKEAPHVQA